MGGAPQEWRLAIRLSAAAGLIAGALMLRLWLMPVSAGSAFITFYPATALCFLVLGTLPGAAATIVSALLAYGLLMPPFHSLVFGKTGWLVTTLFLLSSLSIGFLIGNLRQHGMARNLRQYVARQKAILDNELIGVATIRARRIVWCNRGLEQLLGYEPGGLAGQSTRVWYNDEANYQAVGETAYPILAAGGTYRSEIAMCTKAGLSIWVDMTSTPLDPVTQETLWLLSDITARKAAESAVRDSEARYRLLAQNAHDMIATMSPDSTVLFVTPAIYRVLGYRPDEVVGRRTVDLTHPDDIPASLALFSTLIKAGPNGPVPVYQFRGRHKNGSWIWLEGQPRVEFDASGVPLYFQDVVRDISARKHLEEELRTSQTFLARTSQVAGVGGWEFDLATGILIWSDELCRLLGVPAGYRPTLEEAIGFYDMPARQMITKAVDNGIHSGKSWDLELPITSADGRRFWARAVGAPEFDGGRVVRLLGAFQDVTAQRQMARDLSKSHELLKVTLESIGDAVITTDAHDIVTWINPVAQRLVGLSEDLVCGRPLAQSYFIVDERTRQKLPIFQVEDEQGRTRNNAVLIGHGGSSYGIEERVSDLRDGQGMLLGRVLVFRDVSEERRLAQEMAYRATHDPLTGLTNRAEFELRLARVLSDGDLEHSGHAILFIDLDRFKQVNDHCGHAAGDRLLCRIADLLRASVKAGGTDTVARLGGDEFAIILEDRDAAQAASMADAVCILIEALSFVQDGRQFSIGASIGLVETSKGWSGAEELLNAADIACYAAKKEGRGRVHRWAQGDRHIADWHNDLRKAQEFEHLQPTGIFH